VAALLNVLTNEHGQKKGDRPLYKCRAFPSGSKIHSKAEAKMREEEAATKSRNVQVTILQWQRSPAETFLRNL